MDNKYYKPGGQRAPMVESLFSFLAPRYDLINDLQSLGLHRHWKHLVARMAQVTPGQRALDLCCGTGDIAFALHQAGAQVVGLDFTPAMLEIARARAQKLPRRPDESCLQFVAGDVMHMPFEVSTFDIVTIGYGLRNLESWERGLEAMLRVTREGGRLLVLDFGKPDNWLWRQIYIGYLRTVIPLLGKIICRDAAAMAYIYASLRNYPSQGVIAAKLTALGCREVRVRNLLGGAMSIHSCLKISG